MQYRRSVGVWKPSPPRKPKACMSVVPEVKTLPLFVAFGAGADPASPTVLSLITSMSMPYSYQAGERSGEYGSRHHGARRVYDLMVTI